MESVHASVDQDELLTPVAMEITSSDSSPLSVGFRSNSGGDLTELLSERNRKLLSKKRPKSPLAGDSEGCSQPSSSPPVASKKKGHGIFRGKKRQHGRGTAVVVDTGAGIECGTAMSPSAASTLDRSVASLTYSNHTVLDSDSALATPMRDCTLNGDYDDGDVANERQQGQSVEDGGHARLEQSYQANHNSLSSLVASEVNYSLTAALSKWSQKHPQHARSLSRNTSVRSFSRATEYGVNEMELQHANPHAAGDGTGLGYPSTQHAQSADMQQEQHHDTTSFQTTACPGEHADDSEIKQAPHTAGAGLNSTLLNPGQGEPADSLRLPSHSPTPSEPPPGSRRSSSRLLDAFRFRNPSPSGDASEGSMGRPRSRTLGMPAVLQGLMSRRASKASGAGSSARHTPKAFMGSRHRGDEELFDGPEDSNLMRMVEEKMTMEGLNKKKALVAARVERMVDIHGGEDHAMYFILDKCRQEGEAIILLQHLITHGVDVNAPDDTKRTSLHVAVDRNFVHVAKVLLTNDTSAELTDGEGRLAVEYALDARQDEIAALLLKHMSNERVRTLFEPQPQEGGEWERQKFNFYNLISEPSDMPKSAEAVLDSLVDPTQVPDQYDFHFTILESNSEGVSPFQSSFSLGCKSIFHRLLEIEGLRDHSVVRTLIHHKWTHFGETKTYKNVMFYFLFVFITSFAFISAGRQRAEGFRVVNVSDNESLMLDYELGDPRTYPDVESYFRAICEVLIIIGTLNNLYQEIREMITSELLDYWTDKYNYVQLSTISLFLVLIPLRWTDTDVQWYVAACTYMVVCLRTLQLISVTKVVGIYLQILIEIVKKDVSKFAIIFSIFWIMFSGSTFLVLVGTKNASGTVTGTDLDKISDTGSYSHILLSGLRMMVQAESVVDEYQTKLHWLAVVIQMFFLFTLLIVILNILIAQLSDTYQRVKENAQRTLEQNWASALRNLEQTKDLGERRYRSFEAFVTKENPEVYLITWEKPVDLSEQREGERRQRYVEQQLAKQEQQLVAIRSQLRKSLGMQQDDQVAQRQMEDTLKEMVRQQLPEVMENIVHRNTDEVIHSIGGTTARSAREIEEHVHQRVVQEVLGMLERTTEDVVARVSDMMVYEPPL
eukprot:scpid14930/ scgid13238/ Transient receptor potential cation channel subfamily V member 4; Osm-9-like TRP channel 4; Transient receptor potential protein 12; Vanilloid receptor-like channel 2; Vanilloid receptor-like protein 2; Vanilloid receptor-related osmotically-activated channel